MIPNLFLLTGDNEFHLRERAKIYRIGFQKKYSDGEIAFFDNEKSLTELENLVLTPNLFGGKRMAICEGFWSSETFEKAIKTKFFEKLPDFKENSIIIVVEPKLDKRKKASKYLLKHAKVEKFDLLDEANSLRWIEQYAAKKGSTISRSNAQYLLNRCGDDLWGLSQEITKLATLCDGQEISKENIRSLTRANPKMEIWDFLTNLSQKKSAVAIKKLRGLITSGQSIHQIFSMIQRETRIHVQLRSGLDQGIPPKPLATKCGLHPFVVQKTLPLSKHFSLSQLTQMYDALFQIERSLKTGGISTTSQDTSELELAIEKFIVKVCR